MEIVRDLRDGEASIALVGRLDAAWSDGVGKALEECIRSGAHVVRLDMGRVDFLSSAGIRVLLTTYRQLSKIGGRLSVVRASEAVRSVLELGGLATLLDVPAAGWVETAPAPRETASSATPLRPVEGPVRSFEHAGAKIESWSIDPAARMRLHAVGDPGAILAGRTDAAASVRTSFPRSSFGLGVGAFGADAADGRTRFGEFLAAGGAAVCLAGAEDAVPDWVVAEDRLVPEVEILWGLVGEGGFGVELRFEAAGSESGALGLAEVAALALEVTDAPAVAFVMLAETAQLVGAALRRSPLVRQDGESMFTFPGVRDRLVFTAEPAWAGSLSLAVGVVAREMPDALSAHVRPIVEDGSLAGHVHAAAFPYRPLRKGRLGLDAALATVFEDQAVRGLLHLVNDWRDTVGAGQSSFTRGIAWIARAEVT